jgi:transcriptional regulator with XRE-family HTH domain
MTKTSIDYHPAREWIQSLIETHKMTVTSIASQSMVSQSTLSRFMRGETLNLSANVLAALRRAFPTNIPPELAVSENGSLPLIATETMFGLTSPDAKKIPVWGIFPKRDADEFLINPIPVNYIETPARLMRFGKLAAFYAPDESMAPRWSSGEPVLVDLNRPAGIGDVCFARLLPATDANETESFIFRILGQRSNGFVNFRSFAMPDRDIKIEIRRILEIRHVLTWADMLI